MNRNAPAAHPRSTNPAGAGPRRHGGSTRAPALSAHRGRRHRAPFTAPHGRSIGHVRRILAAAAAERGDTLIEVLASTVMLAVIAMGTVNGIISSNKTTALGRARAEAQAISEQEQEKLRGTPTVQLNSYGNTNTTTKIGGITYTVVNKVEYVNERGASACAVELPNAGFYRLISEVSWKGTGNTAPVRTVGTVPPPAGASMLVHIEGYKKGEPVAGVTVTATGPLPSTTTEVRSTNAQGCALFGPYKEGGKYEVNAYKEHYVDQNGFSRLSEDEYAGRIQNLLTNSPTKASYRFAEAARLKANFATAAIPRFGSWSPVTKVPNVAIATTEGIKPNPDIIFNGTGPFTSPIYASEPGLFPFTYAVYPGTCEENNPMKFGAEKETTAAMTPGALTEVTLSLPALVLWVKHNSTYISNPTVVIHDTACESAAPEFRTGPEARETLSSVSEIESHGDLTEPGVPDGTYEVCAEWPETTPTTTLTTSTSLSRTTFTTRSTTTSSEWYHRTTTRTTTLTTTSTSTSSTTQTLSTTLTSTYLASTSGVKVPESGKQEATLTLQRPASPAGSATCP